VNFQKGNILLTISLVVFVVFFALGSGYFYWQKVVSKENNTNAEQVNPTPALASPAAVSNSFCKPDQNYVDLQACSCPEGTTRTIGAPLNEKEAVLICKTKAIKTTCKNDDFYAQQAMSFKYDVQEGFVTVSGCLAKSPGSVCQEKILNLSPAQGFYLASGKEQSVKVSLEKIENSNAYFIFEYNAAPPAPGGSYRCEFVKEGV